jgi:hypothetical protein
MRQRITLEVHQHEIEDVYRDRARIPERFRGGLKEGRICKFTATNRSILLEVRGILSEPRSIIRLDDRTRAALCIEIGRSYEFQVREVWWIGQFRWAWNASDSAARMAARLGVLGLILGVIAMVLGIIPLVKAC